MTLGEKIKYLRNRLNITQSSLANKANITLFQLENMKQIK